MPAGGEVHPPGRAWGGAERRGGGDAAGDSGWYDGGRLTLSLGKLKPGVYDGIFRFNSMPAGSVYKNCSEDFSFRVTRR